MWVNQNLEKIQQTQSSQSSKEFTNRLTLKEDSEYPDVYVTLSGRDMFWSAAVRDVCTQAGLSVVIPSKYSDKKVDVAFNNTLFFNAIKNLTAQVEDISFNLNDNTIEFTDTTVQTIAVIDSQYADIDEIESVLKDILPKSTKIAQANNRLIIGGTDLSADQSEQITKMIGASEPTQWFVDICILSMSDNWRTSFGISGSIGGVISLDQDTPTVFEYILDSQISASYAMGIDEVLLQTTLTILEGKEASVESTEKIPIPERSVSPQGTVTTSGYSSVQSGISVSIKNVRTPTGLNVEIRPQISDVIGFVEEKPIISNKELNTNLIVKNNSIILLSGIWTNRKTNKVSTFIDLQDSESKSEWLVITRFREYGSSDSTDAVEDDINTTQNQLNS